MVYPIESIISVTASTPTHQNDGCTQEHRYHAVGFYRDKFNLTVWTSTHHLLSQFDSRFLQGELRHVQWVSSQFYRENLMFIFSSENWFLARESEE
jgi:hypothetical protein